MIYSKFIKFFLYLILFINLETPYTNANTYANTHSIVNNYKEDENSEATLKSNLLENYNLVIPSNNHKIDIYLDVDFLSLKQVDQVNNIITSSINLNYKWKDEYIKWDPTNNNDILYTTFSNNAEFDDAIWTPDVYLTNSAEKSLDQLQETKLLVDFEGNVFWKRPGIIETNCEFDLSNFPYDIQKCYFEFSSYSNDINQLNFNYINPKINIDNILKIEEWNINNKPNTEILIKRSEFFKRDFSNIKFYINLQRRPAFYEFNIIMPTFLTASLIIASMFIPWKSGERISFSVTVMLSVLVFLLLLSDLLPKTDKNPFLSNILLALTILCMFVVIFTIIESIAYYKSKKILPKKLKKLYFNYLILKHKLNMYLCKHKNYLERQEIEDNFIHSNINIALYINELNNQKDNNEYNYQSTNNYLNYNINYNINHKINQSNNISHQYNNRLSGTENINVNDFDVNSKLLPRSISNVNLMMNKNIFNQNYFSESNDNKNNKYNYNSNMNNKNLNTNHINQNNVNLKTLNNHSVKRINSNRSRGYYSSDSSNHSDYYDNHKNKLNKKERHYSNTSNISGNSNYIEISTSGDELNDLNEINELNDINEFNEINELNQSIDNKNKITNNQILTNNQNSISPLPTIIDLPEPLKFNSRRLHKDSRKKKSSEENNTLNNLSNTLEDTLSNYYKSSDSENLSPERKKNNTSNNTLNNVSSKTNKINLDKIISNVDEKYEKVKDEEEESEAESEEEDDEINSEEDININSYNSNSEDSVISFEERLKQEIEKQNKIDYNDFIRLVRKIKIIVFSIIFSSFGIVIMSQKSMNSN